MKAITLLQPYASLWAQNLKEYETRGWETLHRAGFAIHAGAKPQTFFTSQQREAIRRAFGWPEGADVIAEIKKLPSGAIIAVADLAECFKVAEWESGLGLEGRLHFNSDGTEKRDQHGRRIPWNEKPLDPSSDEVLFGDFRPGRFAWKKENTILLPQPITYKGNQRWWDVPDEIIGAALKEAAAKEDRP